MTTKALATRTSSRSKKQAAWKSSEAKAERIAARNALVAQAKALKAEVESAGDRKGFAAFWELVDRVMVDRRERNLDPYSFGNFFLIYCQCKHASVLRTFWAWKDLGYKTTSASKGKGIGIQQPRRFEKETASGEIKDAMYCEWITLFDISDVVPMTEEEIEAHRKWREERQAKGGDDAE